MFSFLNNVVVNAKINRKAVKKSFLFLTAPDNYKDVIFIVAEVEEIESTLMS